MEYSSVLMSGQNKDLNLIYAYITILCKSLIFIVCADTQAAVAANRAKFIYSWNLMGLPTANAIILDNICHFVGKGCLPASALTTSLY